MLRNILRPDPPRTARPRDAPPRRGGDSSSSSTATANERSDKTPRRGDADSDGDVVVVVDGATTRARDAAVLHAVSSTYKETALLFPEAHVATFEPKVQVPYAFVRGRVPRQIEIERRRRLYDSQPVSRLLRVAGLDVDELARPSTQRLPLDIFDDTSYDARHPDEWMAIAHSSCRDSKGSSGSGGGDDSDAQQQQQQHRCCFLPAEGVYHDAHGDEYVLRPCRVVGWDAARNEVQVRWGARSSMARADDDDTDNNTNDDKDDDDAVVTLPRIFVRLYAEDPVVYVRRLAAAQQRRAKATAWIMYRLCCDAMPVDGLPGPDAAMLARLRRLGTGIPQLSERVFAGVHAHAERLLRELALVWRRGHNSILLHDRMRHDTAVARMVAGTTHMSLDELLRGPNVAVPRSERGDPRSVVDTRMDAATYEACERAFTFATYYTQPEVVTALTGVRQACMRVLEDSLFDLPSERQMPLEVFAQRQQQHMARIAAYLKGTWLQSVCAVVQGSFASAGKGWLNVRETKQDVYAMSKLKKFFTTVKFMMEDTLFELVYRSLHAFTTFLEEVSAFTVHVRGRNDVVNAWPGSDAADCVERQPLFTIHLVERDGGFAYSVPFDVFDATLVALFDSAIACTRAIPQVERYVMTQYFWRRDDDGPFLASASPDEERVQALRARVRAALHASLAPLHAYLRTYDELLPLVQLDQAEFADAYAREAHTMAEMREEIVRHLRAKRAVAEHIPPFLTVGNFVVDCQSFSLAMAKKEDDLARLVMQIIAKRAKAATTQLRDEFGKLVRVLDKQPQSVEKLYEAYHFLDSLDDRVAELHEGIDEMRQYYAVLDSFQYELTDDESRHKWEAIAWPRQLALRTRAVRKELEAVQEELHTRLQKEQDEFAKKVEQLQRVVATFSRYTDAAEADKVAAEVKTRNLEIRQCIDEARAINADQRLFGDKPTDYRNVFELDKEFKPYSDLWLTTYTWQESYRRWHADAFDTLDADEIESTVTTAFKTMTALARTFKDKTATLRIVDEVRTAVERFKPWVPLVTSLRHPGMKERHWTGLSEKLSSLAVDSHGSNSHGNSNSSTGSNTLRLVPGETILLLEDCAPLLAHKDVIVSYCEVAAKELQIERALHEMRARWEARQFVVEAYKETGTYVLKDTTEIMELLDEHLNLTQQLQFSPFRAYFEEAITDWERSLNLIADVLEQWLECQRAWRYLEPIFASDDIATQLPALSRVFERVDKIWRRTMASAHAKPNVLEFCMGTGKLLDHLREANRLLEEVQRGLNDYLAEKRQTFARFYFLSDEELLEILSQAKEVRRIDANIGKLFEFIRVLEWDGGNSNSRGHNDGGDDTTTTAGVCGTPRITGFYSAEDEYVPSVQPVVPEGNVEVWLRGVEAMMKDAVHAQVRCCYEDYVATPRPRWVLAWPAQCVIAVAQIYWTCACEEALRAHGSVDRVAARLERQLHELVEVVQSPLTPTQRINMGALITIEVHAKDTVDAMRARGVGSTREFDWAKQLRFYWERADGRCHVRQVDAAFVYGGEYLGNTSRLVVTPLTDRIYLTLTGALALCLGGAPAGPAGTGKTETVKDLAKALAKQCVVFNCQEGMTYASMGKFFKGLAWTGAWACFDEFNRIDVEVLSVVAQQVTDLQQACLTRQYRIVFEGSDVLVDPTHAVFITMNPGYAGRTELPDNLKVLFRPVACMVPDYAMIAEIRLFSYGYAQARTLARKMVATFKLSSEQLSSQDHYDFGMRAVNTVISAAGLNKREHPDESEDVLLLRALRDSNAPKFLRDDLLLFDGIVSDLFPGVELRPTDYGSIVGALERALAAAQLQPVPAFVAKCLQLYDITTLRHGLMLVGPAGSGKTTAYTTLQTALCDCAARQAAAAAATAAQRQRVASKVSIDSSSSNSNHHAVATTTATTTTTTTTTMTSDDAATAASSERAYMRVYVHVCNPKAVTMDQLYGAYDENGEWRDGVLCVLFRRAARYGEEGNQRGKHWLLFDGPVDALWIESMNTVLDENKKLCLVSGEIIQMNRDMTMIFEVEDLAVASPATVSRCGMVYLDSATCVPLDAAVATWVRALPAYMSVVADALTQWTMTYMPPLLHLVRTQLREYVPSTDNGLAYAFFRMMRGFVASFAPGKAAAAASSSSSPQPQRQQASSSSTAAAAAAATVTLSPERTEALQAAALPLFFFALVWSVGATCDEDGRRLFSARLCELADEHGHSDALPRDVVAAATPTTTTTATTPHGDEAQPLVYDYCVLYNPAGVTDEAGDAAANNNNNNSNNEVRWVAWRETRSAAALQVPHGARYDDILVPTVDNIRQDYVLRHLLLQKVHVAAMGPTGTGKSVALAQLVLNGGLPSNFLGLSFTFSAQTRAPVLQASLMAKFDKRRSHVYGAPVGKHFVVLIEDANLPQKERYGAQPPLELLRQLLGHGGFYACGATVKWNTIIDTSLALAMGPPGGGRASVSARFLRHFNYVTFPEMTDASKRDIVRTILRAGFAQHGVADDVAALGDALVEGTLRLFKRCCRAFLPTPAHVHYTFNMRDVMRVFPMLFGCDGKALPTRESLVTLWMHEAQRVFCDRLLSDADRATFRSFIDDELRAMGVAGDYATLVRAERLIYGDFASLVQDSKQHHSGAGPASSSSSSYVQVRDMQALTAHFADVLASYNDASETRMDLVLFLDAIEHVCRIARVLRMPSGHCLLLGIGGSGRKSLTRLACHLIADMDVFTMELTKSFGLKEWHESLARLLLECGKDDKKRTFLFSDTQLVHPAFLEEVATLLTAGDVPNLFEDQDMDLIHDKFRAICVAESLPTTKVSVYARFVKEVRANLHVVLAFSPIGEAFRSRLRMFPSLVACCTIDWFAEWPAEALLSVAAAQLRSSGVCGSGEGEHSSNKNNDNSNNNDDDDDAASLQRRLADCVRAFHQDAARVTERFFVDTQRRSYVTPTAYLAVLNSFADMVDARRRRTQEQRGRLENGLDKLREAEACVAELEAQLKAQQPVLEAKKDEIRSIMARLTVDRREAAVREADARREETAATVKAEECAKMRRECATRLAEAEPALAEAVKVLSRIKASEIGELNKYQNPPKGVQYVMEAVALLLTFGNCPKEYLAGPPGGKKTPDWWACAKSYMRDANRLLDVLVQPHDKGGFNREAMDMALMEKVKAYYDNDEFQPDKVKSVSVPCMAMCLWVRAMYRWFFVNRDIQPLRARLADAECELARVTAALHATRATLSSVVAAVAALEREYTEATDTQATLEAAMEQTSLKLQRAARLIDGLGGEKARWLQLVARYVDEEHCIRGDMLLAAATVAYCGPLTAPYRRELRAAWTATLARARVPTSAHGDDVVQTLGDAVQVQAWRLCGLPSDALSTENAIIMAHARNWPLLIDPQGQANAWLRALHKADNLQVCKASSERFMKTIENAIRLGLPCLLENVGDVLDAALEPVLLKRVFLIGSTPHVRIGDSAIPYDRNFRLYMTTKLPNPCYTPETIVTVSLLNFFITPHGLEEQLLGVAVGQERADLEQEKQKLTRDNAEKQRELQVLQESILRMLEDAEGDLLEQEQLIVALEQSKSKSLEITRDLQKAHATEHVIDAMRDQYRPHAARGSLLFFCVAALAAVDPMYQFSLQWFMHLFVAAMRPTGRAGDDKEGGGSSRRRSERGDSNATAGAPPPPLQQQRRSRHGSSIVGGVAAAARRKSELSDAATAAEVAARVTLLIDQLTYTLYANVCRSLFEKHKLTFSFFLCTRVLAQRGELDAAEWRYLLTGPTGPVDGSGSGNGNEDTTSARADDDDNNNNHKKSSDDGDDDARVPRRNPAPEWLTEASWAELCFVSVRLPQLAGLAQHVAAHVAHYKELFDSADAHAYALAAPWQARVTPLQRLLVTRCLRKDKVAQGIRGFVQHYLGARYTVAPPFDLADAYRDSDCVTPLVFINAQGSDPMSDLLRFAEAMRMSRKLDKVSLGQGQGAKAEELIARARETGAWVLLQNCHLATSWMPTLEAIVESFTYETVKKEFRLWLTSMPTSDFPVAVLQNAVKMTNEPPMGLRANVTRSLSSLSAADLQHAEKPRAFALLVFALCLFHGVLQERRQFGSLGFNIPYEFNDSDRAVCLLQLRKFLSLYDEVPFDVLTFLTGEINYGGRVTDDWDRRCMMTLIARFLQPAVLEVGYAFSPSGVYTSIEPCTREAYVEYLRTSWPLHPLPEVFGLHENADITCAQNTTHSILDTLLTLDTQGGSGDSGAGGDGGGARAKDGDGAPHNSREQMLAATAAAIERKLPPLFDVAAFAARYPTRYAESMNTVLVQEAVRYNRLLSYVQASLSAFVKAIRGEVVMSAELDAVGASFYINAVPTSWSALAYPSRKPLSSWVDDLVRRTRFVQAWYAHGAPRVFWFGGFFFPQAFLTGTLQNYARQVRAAVDTISFRFVLQDEHIAASSSSNDDDDDGDDDRAQQQTTTTTAAVRRVARPDKGALVYGLYLEGARWDAAQRSLAESRPKELYVEMPVVHLDPVVDRVPDARDYVCPVYKTLTRAGTLSTTGHSTNFVLSIEVPTLVDPRHWVERGVACVISLDY